MPAASFSTGTMIDKATALMAFPRWLTANGLNLGGLLAFAALFGFGGAFISLAMSNPPRNSRLRPYSKRHAVGTFFPDSITRSKT